MHENRCSRFICRMLVLHYILNRFWASFRVPCLNWTSINSFQLSFARSAMYDETSSFFKLHSLRIFPNSPFTNSKWNQCHERKQFSANYNSIGWLSLTKHSTNDRVKQPRFHLDPIAYVSWKTEIFEFLSDHFDHETFFIDSPKKISLFYMWVLRSYQSTHWFTKIDRLWWRPVTSTIQAIKAVRIRSFTFLFWFSNSKFCIKRTSNEKVYNNK